MIGIDTHVLLRFLTDDDPRQSAMAKRFVQGLPPEDGAHVSLLTPAELAWVLGSRYAASPSEIASTIEELLSDARFDVQDHAIAWAALDAVHRLGAGMADALIALGNLERGCSHTVTFDRRALRLPGVVLLQ